MLFDDSVMHNAWVGNSPEMDEHRDTALPPNN